MTYCYKETARDAYLLDVYKCLAQNESGLFDELNAGPGGRAGQNVYQREVVMPERERRREEEEEESGGVVAGAALPIRG